MRIIKCGIKEFSSRSKNKKIICFGASANINSMSIFYPEYDFAHRITAIADNDEEKQEKGFYKTWFNTFPIISVQELVDRCLADSDYCILITSNVVDEIVRQLESISELSQTECYIYGLFPYLDMEAIPEAILKLRQGKPIIPKVIHYCWLGGKDMPEKNQKCIDSWKKYCPDYELKLWNEDNYDFFKHPFMKAAYDKQMWGFVPDYARLDIIYHHGGIYLDADVEMLRDFDDLLYSKAFFGLVAHTVINAGHGFGAVAGSGVVKNMRDIYDAVVFAYDGSSFSHSAYLETIELRKHGYIGGNRHFVHPEFIIYPVEYFNPKSTMYGIRKITDHCHSIHHFDYSWSSEIAEIQAEKQEYFDRLFKAKG